MKNDSKHMRFVIPTNALMTAVGVMSVNTHCFITNTPDGLYFTITDDANEIGANVYFSPESIRWYQNDVFYVGIDCQQLDMWLRTIFTEEVYVSINEEFALFQSDKHSLKLRTCTDEHKYVEPKFAKGIRNVHTYSIDVDFHFLHNCIGSMECFTDCCYVVPKPHGLSLTTNERCGVTFDAKQYDVSFWISGKTDIKGELWGYSMYKSDLLHTAISKFPYRQQVGKVSYGKDVPIEFSFEKYGGVYSVFVVPLLLYC